MAAASRAAQCSRVASRTRRLGVPPPESCSALTRCCLRCESIFACSTRFRSCSAASLRACFSRLSCSIFRSRARFKSSSAALPPSAPLPPLNDPEDLFAASAASSRCRAASSSRLRCSFGGFTVCAPAAGLGGGARPSCPAAVPASSASSLSLFAPSPETRLPRRGMTS